MLERVERLPQGGDTLLEKSVNQDAPELSGGEAQKVALARALYKDSPVVVLDEPTAALDPIAESEVYRNFNRFVGGRGAVFISHRLSSCRFCRRIAVFDEGHLVNTGSTRSCSGRTASTTGCGTRRRSTTRRKMRGRRSQPDQKTGPST